MEFSQEQADLASAYYFCTHSSMTKNTSTRVMRTIVAQLIRSRPDLLPYVHHNYVDKTLNPSSKSVRRLLSEMLASIECPRIVLDGIDECDEAEQKEIVSVFLELQKNAAESCKILFASRNDESDIKSLLQHKTLIALKGQTNEAIRLFVNSKVEDIKGKLGCLDGVLLDKIRFRLSSKAQGECLKTAECELSRPSP